MAQQIETLPEGGPGGSSRTYPWAVWLDGEAWMLTRGEDFEVSVKSFDANARQAAKRRGGRIEARFPDGMDGDRIAFRYVGEGASGSRGKAGRQDDVMGERLEALPGRQTGGGRGKYPWGLWLDGQPWLLVRGNDFEVTPTSFYQAARGAAKRRGGYIEARFPDGMDGDRIALKFFEDEGVER